MQSTNYCIRPRDLKKLERGLSDEKSPNFEALDEKDQQAITNMIFHCLSFPILVRVAPLDPGSEAVDWTSERTWFDEVVAMCKQRNLDDGFPWRTGTEDVGSLREERRDSFRSGDWYEWTNEIQGERDITLTFADLPSLEKSQLDTAIPHIKEIIPTYGDDDDDTL